MIRASMTWRMITSCTPAHLRPSMKSTAAWATSAGNPQQYLRVYVASMRRKLEPDPLRPTLIITEPGVGYRMETE